MILLIDNYDSFTYNLYQSIAEFDEVIVVRNDKITVSKIQRLKPNGIIISPGPGRPEDAGNCIGIIRKFSHKIPIFGVCLGFQAIVAAFNGKIIQSDEIIHGKSSYIFHNRKGIYENISLPFSAGRYHSLIAERKSLPESLEIQSENEGGLIMGVKHKEYPCFGVQFHPESILTQDGQEILKNFIVQYCQPNNTCSELSMISEKQKGTVTC